MELPPPEVPNGLVADPPVGVSKRQARRSRYGSGGKQDALPIEEALKTELSGVSNIRTPISLLQELLSRRGITPQYDLMQVEGAVHEPTFRYRVCYEDKDAMGTGKSKKEAKHAAATALIDKLRGISLSDPATGTLKVKPEQVGEGEDEPTGNPIGLLQELCMSRRCPPPTYKTEMEDGLPHERQFTITCSVSKYHEVGKGTSKKTAKRQAAHRMWQRLQEEPLEPNPIVQITDEECHEECHEEPKETTITERYTGLKDARMASLTTDQKVSQFYKSIKAPTGETLSKLRDTCLNNQNVDFVQMLRELATEQQFEVTYVHIDEKAISGRFQCFVQLTTTPFTVCQGSGTSAKNAQAAAARNSLEYLKIMTKARPVRRANHRWRRWRRRR
ncbi:interferon-inducible double-stranded RNA-dependent protein kinase activator A homolog [Sabethes cyaneus]|uniref:interferon-inducible double-stranded RNA-dependent protein kinase activator A homolog n=1 Tax=Sabethes cyaneus TaxID=53552 RepID=UPI00237EC2FC|nr:interferon-inducible double-stranded RNA-dependent protein kinase activator A homolog [Sabethes cyaneus]